MSMFAGYGLEQLGCVLGTTTKREAIEKLKETKIVISEDEIIARDVTFSATKCDQASLYFEDGFFSRITYYLNCKAGTRKMYRGAKKKITSQLGAPFNVYDRDMYSVVTWVTDDTIVELEEGGKEFVMVSVFSRRSAS